MSHGITSTRLRAARALLDGSITALSEVAHVSVSTVNRMAHDHLRRASDRSIAPIRRAVPALKGLGDAAWAGWEADLGERLARRGDPNATIRPIGRRRLCVDP